MTIACVQTCQTQWLGTIPITLVGAPQSGPPQPLLLRRNQLYSLKRMQHKHDQCLHSYFEGQGESLKVEAETDDMNRAVIHKTLKGSGTLPNVVRLRDQELARALFPGVPVREVETQLGRPVRELSYNTLVFGSSLPAVAALSDDEQVQTFVTAGFVRIWEQSLDRVSLDDSLRRDSFWCGGFPVRQTRRQYDKVWA